MFPCQEANLWIIHDVLIACVFHFPIKWSFQKQSGWCPCHMISLSYHHINSSLSYPWCRWAFPLLKNMDEFPTLRRPAREGGKGGEGQGGSEAQQGIPWGAAPNLGAVESWWNTNKILGKSMEIQHLVCFQKKWEVETQNNMGVIAVGNWFELPHPYMNVGKASLELRMEFPNHFW